MLFDMDLLLSVVFFTFSRLHLPFAIMLLLGFHSTLGTFHIIHPELYIERMSIAFQDHEGCYIQNMEHKTM